MVVAATSRSLAAPADPMPVAEDRVRVVPEIFSLPIPSAEVTSVMEPAVAVTLEAPEAFTI